MWYKFSMPPISKLFLITLFSSLLFAVIKIYKQRIKNIFTGLAICAMLFTTSSLFWTADTAYDTENLQHLEFGWPIPFWVQNQSKFEPPFPWEMYFGYELSGSSEYPANKVILDKLFLSLAINLLLAWLGWLLLNWPSVRYNQHQ